MEEKTEEQYQKEEDAVFDMFTTDGWKYFIANLKETREATLQAAPQAAASGDQWQYARGMLYQMDSFIGYEAYLRAVREQDEAEDEDELD